MPKGSDDALARASLLKVIEAARLLCNPNGHYTEDGGVMSNAGKAIHLLEEAEELANRIDAPRGRVIHATATEG